MSNKDNRSLKKYVNSETSVSDKFDRNTDRIVMDGRKARMGLRVDECGQRSTSNTPINKSESSECFVPHVSCSNDKVKNMFVNSSTNSSTQILSGAMLDERASSR